MHTYEEFRVSQLNGWASWNVCSRNMRLHLIRKKKQGIAISVAEEAMLKHDLFEILDLVDDLARKR